MIKYSLVCDRAHDFESWFESGASYETLARRGLIACPSCHSTSVSKAIMAPALAGRARPADAPVPVAMLDERQQKLRAMARTLRAEIEKNSEDVGGKFPEVARAIHDGDAPGRSIRGRASLEEARALIEDGIGVLPLPFAPDEMN